MDSIRRDPEIIAKNECIGALFGPVTGEDPFLNDSLRAAIDYALSEEHGSPAPLEAFMRKAVELSSSRGTGEAFSMLHINLRERAYDPLWLRGELLEGLKPMTGIRRCLIVISGLREAVHKSITRSERKKGKDVAHEDARQYIDSLAAKYAADNSRLTIMYLD